MPSEQPVVRALGRPPAADAGLLAVAVAAASTSGPLMASAAAVVPVLAIAFWRNAMAAALLTPAAVWRRRGELRALRRREWLLALVAGAFLALHFATWAPSLTMTSVASATALVATMPIWQAVFARVAGERVPARAWLGIAAAVLACGWLSGADLSLGGRHLEGDLLALAGGFAAAAYVATGAHVRRSVSATTYTAVCYSAAAVLLAVAGLAAGERLSGFPLRGWVELLALTAGAQLLGHSLLNIVLRTTSPTVVALALLLEVPGAALIAALWLGQAPSVRVWPAAALLVGSIALVVTSDR